MKDLQVNKIHKFIILSLALLGVTCFFLEYSVARDSIFAVEKALNEYENIYKLDTQPVFSDADSQVRSEELLESSKPLSFDESNIPSAEDIEKFLAAEGLTDEKGILEDTQGFESELSEEVSSTDDNTKETSIISMNGSAQDSTGSGEAIIDVLQLKYMDIVDVLNLISRKGNLNIVAGKSVHGKVTIYLKDVKLKDALRVILDSNDLAYRIEDGIYRIMPAKEFENRYGYKFGGKIQTRIIHIKYAKAGEVMAILNQLKSSSGKIIFDDKSRTLVLIDSPNILDVMEHLVKEVDIPIETRFFDLNHALAKNIAEQLSEVLTENVGEVRFDERSNKLVVTDTPEGLEKIARVIEAFDIREKQVLIEAKILQIVLSDRHKFGVDWQALVPDYHESDFISNFDILTSSEKKGRVRVGTISNDNYTVFLEALETIGDTNTLSSPSIIVLNNQEARILVGSTEPYVTSTTTTPSSGPATTAESVNFIDVGVKLYVTPTIHRDDFITMKIKPEVSTVTSSITTSNNNTIPIVDTSEAETIVMVKSGVTIIIGGLIKEERIETINKVPILGDIPFFGRAFRNDDLLVKKTETAIFLTPTIISGDAPDEDELVLDVLTNLP